MTNQIAGCQNNFVLIFSLINIVENLQFGTIVKEHWKTHVISSLFFIAKTILSAISYPIVHFVEIIPHPITRDSYRERWKCQTFALSGAPHPIFIILLWVVPNILTSKKNQQRRPFSYLYIYIYIYLYIICIIKPLL